ncbi:MAG: M3 family oligoendopeptidase [Anaerolineae bacterium]|nr:M3 family oligoendopeptidase [Anaerolineae bacterium]
MATTADKTFNESRWSLGDLFPGHDTPEMQSALEELEKRVAKFEARRDQLNVGMDFEDFMDTLTEMEANTRKASRIGQFAGLWFSEDTQNQDAQAFQARIQQIMATLQNRTLFFSLWWKELDDEQAERLMKDSGEFQYWLEEMRHYKPYTLSEPEEQLINIKDVTGISALQRLYSSITNRYVYMVEVDGEVKELTRGELMDLVYRPDPDLRAAAYQELYRVYGEDGPILGQMYQTVVQDWRNEGVDLRGYSNPISIRNMANDIPDEVIDTLLDVAENNAGLFQRFFKLKTKLLGLKKLRRYDIYAPVTTSSKKYSYDEAVKMVQEAFVGFDPKIAELAQRVYDDEHIDSEVRKGKRGGAFCSSGDPALTPWVLVNYNGSARDVSTLAHELGHAIHAMLAEHHNVFSFHSTLPLAETASTFAEMVLIDHMLANEESEEVRRDILFYQVDDNYATIMRQIFFALFEREAHEMVKDGASVDQMSDAYMKNLEKQFGDAVEVADEFRWEWVSIPHIYQVPFYVYAYAFGQLLVLALYQQYKAEGEAFIPRYFELLSTGGSKSPDEILKKAGVDMREANFWQGGFDVLEGMIAELEKMTK